MQFTESLPEDNELTDFHYLDGLEEEIKSFFRHYKSTFIKFFKIFENKVND